MNALPQPLRRRLRDLMSDTGCVSYDVVRVNKHAVIDFTHPSVHQPVRQVLSVTASDGRAYANQVAEINRAVKRQADAAQSAL